VRVTRRDRRAIVVEVGGGAPTWQQPASGSTTMPGTSGCSARGHSLIPWPNRLRDGVYEFDAPILQAPGQHCVPSYDQGIPVATEPIDGTPL
jgi:galactose mutarotase-like enzyme